MPTDLIITVSFDDETDEQFLRIRIIGAVEDVIEEARGEERLDGNVEVSWDLADIA